MILKTENPDVKQMIVNDAEEVSELLTVQQSQILIDEIDEDLIID